jgi:hypothetical protein
MWPFDLDKPAEAKVSEKDREADAMTYVLTFGKHRGDSFAGIMRTEDGRRYLRWLQAQTCDNPEFREAHDKRVARITTCFEIFEAYVDTSSNKA